MRILFRVDGNPETGLGHVIRSIGIAREITYQGSKVVAFAGKYSNEILLKLSDSQLKVYQPDKVEDEISFIKRIIMITGADALFIDNLFPYSKENINELKIQSRVILFHNLCDGRFSPDVFILPSAHHSDEIIHDIRWGRNTVDFYHGFKYIPVNEEVKSFKHTVRKSKKIAKIAITTGGSDPRRVMISILNWLSDNSYHDINFIALTGAAFTMEKDLKEIMPGLPANINLLPFHYRHFAEADLAISTFGVTSYELLYLGIPFLSISHAETNAEGSRNLSKKIPLIKDLGLIDQLTRKAFYNSLDEIIKDPDIKTRFQKLSTELLDGKGINRIANIILAQT